MKIKTTGPVQHDGKNVKPGTILTLSDEAAAQMIDAGAAEAVSGDKAGAADNADNGSDAK